MNIDRGIERVDNASTSSQVLRSELDKARAALADAEAELAGEQAAVNAFRMHCRLRLDDLVGILSELRSEKEMLLVEIELLRQGVDPAYLNDDDPLADGAWFEETIGEEEPLLPTDTPGDKAAEKRLYRELARRFHPDLAASAFERSYRTTIMSAVNNAYAARDSEALYDLAGDLSPIEAARLTQISDIDVRRIRQSINKMRRLEGKARRQLANLRQENTARLWRRAQQLNEQDEDGWSLIRRELELAISRRRVEVNKLSSQVAKLSQAEQDS